MKSNQINAALVLLVVGVQACNDKKSPQAIPQLAAPMNLPTVASVPVVAPEHIVNETPVSAPQDPPVAVNPDCFTVHRCVEQKAFIPHQDGLLSLRWDRAASHLATASADKSAKILDSSGQVLLELSGHDDDVNSAFFSADGNRVLTSSRDGTARLYDARSAELINVFSGHLSSVYQARFGEDGTQIVTVSEDGFVRVFQSTYPYKLLRIIQSGSAHSAQMSRNGTRIFVACNDGFVRVYSAQTGLLFLEQRVHEASIYSLEMNPDGTQLVTASADGSSKVLHAGDLKVISNFSEKDDSIYVAVFNADGSRVAVGTRKGLVAVYDPQNGVLVDNVARLSRSVQALAFSKDGFRLSVGSSDGRLGVWGATSR